MAVVHFEAIFSAAFFWKYFLAFSPYGYSTDEMHGPLYTAAECLIGSQKV
jgi:hypothetical protein